MNHQRLRRLFPIAAIAVASILLTACGSGMQGTYKSHKGAFFDKLTFNSGGKLEITFMGMTKDGSYVVDDRKVRITVGNDNQVFTLDDKGCLVGGGLLGTYCRD
jgi:hypothetical protein